MEKLHDNIITEFDHFAEDYTHDMRRMVPYYDRLLTSMVDCIPKENRVEKILDLGCGNGNVTCELLRRFPNVSYVLADASPEMLKISNDRFSEFDIDYVECFFKDLELARNSLDVVAAAFSLHHVNSVEKQSIFKKVYHWLRPGGVFTSSDLMINKNDADHPQLLLEWEAYARSNNTSDEEWKWIMEHYDVYDSPDNADLQIEWLKEAGFSQVGKFWNIGYWVCLRGVK
jgi:tRNA (cmo5U34)-methyltransferase